MASQSNSELTLHVSMLDTICNQRTLISFGDLYVGHLDRRLYLLLRLKYIDTDTLPKDIIIWERESNDQLSALPGGRAAQLSHCPSPG